MGAGYRKEYDRDSREWLEHSTRIMRRAMYDTRSNFVRATKEADHDFATFGQAVLSVELYLPTNTLLYRTWHLRDVVWAEDYTQKINRIFRRWKPSAADLISEFPKGVHEKVREAFGRDPNTVIKCMHIIYPAALWRGGKPKADIRRAENTPWVSVYVDCENNHVMLEQYTHNKTYIIPRWERYSSQYAHSPSVVAALPDARLLQSISLVLLEAGEKTIDPTLIVQDGVLKSDLNFFRGGAIYVDKEYDEKRGAAVSSINVDKTGLQYGLGLRTDTRDMITEAFFLNQIAQPNITDPNMTAFQVGQLVQEYIRNAQPLFGPIVPEYNGGICELTSEILYRANAFGSIREIPEGLADSDITFTYESPLTKAIETQKANKFMETKALLVQGVEADASVANMMDVKTALYDVLEGIRTPAKWLRNREDVDAMTDKQNQDAEAQKMLATVGAGAEVATQIGNAAAALKPLQA